LSAILERLAQFNEVIMKLLLLFSLISFNLLADEVVPSNTISGSEAEKIFNELKGYEYNTGAITKVLEYHLTVKHDDKTECQKEETYYPGDKSSEIIYTCTI
jgi:hypothetical protein